MAKSQIDDILLKLQKDVVRAVDGKITKEVKDIYKEEVDFMYQEYEPISYERRYDNKGFADDANWNVEVELKNNRVELTLTNEAEAVNSKMRLDKIIEEGIYNWTDNIGERPVYERTQNRIENEQLVDNVLEGELKKQGWKFK